MTEATSDALRARKERLARAIYEMRQREERARQSDLGERGRPGGLMAFIRYFWHVLEPNTPLVEGWAMQAICLHLEAVTRGEIKRLLINVPPGFAKSVIVNALWPAWEWSAAGQPHQRYLSFSYAAHLTERDNKRFRDILLSPAFKEMWGRGVSLTALGVIKPSNNHKGWKFASSIGGVGTGERANRVIADDLHNVHEAESDAIRSGTVQWVREGMSNRLNDMQADAIISIGQRVHEDDVSNALLDIGGYCHLVIQMEYDPQRAHATDIGWEDPRTEFGELAWPERFPEETVAQLKRTLGPYAYASQYQQTPEPRGGGILKRDWWGALELPLKATIPHKLEYIVASLDPAFTAREENDPSGFTVWGVYYKDNRPKIVLLHAWKKWLELHGQTVRRLPNEEAREYVRRTSPGWGLVEWVAHDCTRLRVHKLLIEDKASGHSVAQELQRLYAQREWAAELVNPGRLDKRARALAVQHLFADGMIEAPAAPHGDVLMFRDWAQMVIDECAKFRGLSGDEDNLVDSTTQALKYLRDTGLAIRSDERQWIEEEEGRVRPNQIPLYPA